MTRARFLMISAVVVALLGLRFLGGLLPRPLATVEEQCRDSPVRPACRALVRGTAAPDLAGLRDLADPLPPDMGGAPLVAGVDALERGWPVVAYRLCSAAAAEVGRDQVPGYVCAARAALKLHWYARAAWLAGQALQLQDDPDAHLVLGLALEAQRDLKGARLELLKCLDLEPDNRAALEGLRRVGGTPPPRPDLHGDLDEEVAHARA